jgi:hypothetical protein
LVPNEFAVSDSLLVNIFCDAMVARLHQFPRKMAAAEEGRSRVALGHFGNVLQCSFKSLFRIIEDG